MVYRLYIQLGEKSGLQFVKFNVGVIIMMSERRDETKKDRNKSEEEENPSNVGPGITESNEEV